MPICVCVCVLWFTVDLNILVTLQTFSCILQTFVYVLPSLFFYLLNTFRLVDRWVPYSMSSCTTGVGILQTKVVH